MNKWSSHPDFNWDVIFRRDVVYALDLWDVDFILKYQKNEWTAPYRGFVLQRQDHAWFSLNLMLVKTPHAFVFAIDSWKKKNIPVSHRYRYYNYTTNRPSSKDEIVEIFEFQYI